jgi:aryl-alcohol dehydrogenase-like predicted oxidoreductase
MTESKPAAAAGTITVGGHTVNRMGFGAMRITGEGIWGPPDDHDDAIRVLRRALDLGIDFIDTADSYGPAVSEELIAEALHPYPDGVLIATKAGQARPGPGRWQPDCRPEHLKEAVHGSLKRLKVDQIDLLQLHTVDRNVAYDDSVGALKELQDEGKIVHIGVSNVDVDHLAKARKIVDVVSVQDRYNIGDRESEGVLDACEAEGIAFIPWRPVAAGGLSGDGLHRVAERHEATPAQVALAWLLSRSKVMLPIPGTSKVSHLEENAAAAELELTREDLADLHRP